VSRETTVPCDGADGSVVPRQPARARVAKGQVSFQVRLPVSDRVAARDLLNFFKRAQCPAKLIDKQQLEVLLPYDNRAEAAAALRFAVSAWQRSFSTAVVQLPSRQKLLRIVA
jgi:hypothetical protein